ncbi:MAG: hypothetical protein A3F82_08975 [Deltaproteobacteria bacterium RIFCSPLOWO2_12_FULL_44_12]|nr:MAG: hypothetical protein A2712_00755 [Deltaproteobacteria bacterium RIFCSPHIGHO2_01_FULL_43_49]OGQ14196.1 MAG: hypothetical protein A3D22_09855 [Deltaproteobacteria bacterium RIFCSPHIGHO2_02_FULL_44_53]OGQ27412.1 MAG: hypothetical protein A3D98_03455 [Deltaproteobacteria bacterium RIFCSPHIGHO2_12_FULL_44_21]OGQ30660.1 MAG: hypothetical protein A2979_05880 [Deltaproteobacteria bacterium RIFCSPLOWO2_01_FULL_45_74]OGQ69243.1 MAG: hypothetical protein A3F82_08975 [Deltaproteobacteria bacterium 
MRLSLLLASLLLCFSGRSAHAWSGYTHSLIAEESLKNVAKEWGLESPIRITSFESFLKKLSQEKPEIQTREDFAKWLQINPKGKFDHFKKEEKIGENITPFKVLTFSSPRADDGRDKHIPYDPVEQFWFGKGTKTASQAFRHMEKPPFNLFDPLNTFGFPLGRIGQASERAQIYFDLALLAYRLKEPYWAFNFLGCALHYLQDLQQPYHAAQLSPPLAFEGIKAYLRWGRKEKWGLIKTITHVTANTHHYFEGYVDYQLTSNNSSVGKLWKEALSGESLLPQFTSALGLAKQVRDFSNRFSYDTIKSTFKITGKSLTSSYTYAIDDEEGEQLHPEDPTPYLNPDHLERVKAADTLSPIVHESFQQQGKVIRTVIRAFLDQAQKI